MYIDWEFSPELSCRSESIRKHDCQFYIGTDATGNPAFLKKAYAGTYASVYQKKFDEEFTRMSQIRSKLFPRYYKKSSYPSYNSPYVIMEYFPSDKFITLEEYLCMQHTSNKYSEQRLIDDELFTSLLRNLHEGLKVLFDHGLLYLDLQPENILINPKTREIRLVDFTDCYDLHSKETPSFKLADENLDPNSPPAVLLTRVFCLLIARLHYAGSVAYGNFPVDVSKFMAKYESMFDDILCYAGRDPMEDKYLSRDDYQENAFTMYRCRYQKFMDEFNRGKFRNPY